MKYRPTKLMAKDSTYDKEKADRAVAFIQSLKHTKGQWAGKPFNLLPWQEQIIRDLFGIVKSSGYRQFNTAYVEVPKNVENKSLQRLLLCSSPAVILKSEPRFTAVRQTASRHRLSLKLLPIW